MVRESTKDLGRLGEDIACTFLKRKGFQIVIRNYRRKLGEIDIVAKKDGVLRFIEVKSVSRENNSDGDYRPEEQIHPRKLSKIRNIASLYVEEYAVNGDYQIDAVGVIINTRGKTAKCRLFERIS